MTAVPATGTRLRSAACSTEVVVIRLSPAAGPISCGGVPMTTVAEKTASSAGGPRPGFEGGAQLGKRYTVGGDAAIELLVTKPGKYGLSIDGTPLAIKEAKPLPASD